MTPPAAARYLRDLLSRYGHHDTTCPLQGEPNSPGDKLCTCGLSAALMLVEPPKPANIEEMELLRAAAKSIHQQAEKIVITTNHGASNLAYRQRRSGQQNDSDETCAG